MKSYAPGLKWCGHGTALVTTHATKQTRMAVAATSSSAAKTKSQKPKGFILGIFSCLGAFCAFMMLGV